MRDLAEGGGERMRASVGRGLSGDEIWEGEGFVRWEQWIQRVGKDSLRGRDRSLVDDGRWRWK